MSRYDKGLPFWSIVPPIDPDPNVEIVTTAAATVNTCDKVQLLISHEALEKEVRQLKQEIEKYKCCMFCVHYDIDPYDMALPGMCVYGDKTRPCMPNRRPCSRFSYDHTILEPSVGEP